MFGIFDDQNSTYIIFAKINTVNFHWIWIIFGPLGRPNVSSDNYYDTHIVRLSFRPHFSNIKW